jgi:hypothetical protein
VSLRRRGVVAASRHHCGVAASLRQFDGSQALRRRDIKSTVESGTTSHRHGFFNWKRVAVARDAPLWFAPGTECQAFSSIQFSSVPGIQFE